MRKLLFLLPLLLTTAAQAVDVLPCRAIQKAYASATYEKNKRWSSSYDAALEQVMREECGSRTNYFHPVEEKRTAYLECTKLKLTSELQQRIQGIAMENTTWIAAVKKEKKIKAVYDAEGCRPLW